ncbi:MAG TPA: hypothetical protein VFF03_13780 [Rhodocyclaceae bacterium]|nr:hypothetical protein [Rhodocyclaceae bacterium]
MRHGFILGLLICPAFRALAQAADAAETDSTGGLRAAVLLVVLFVIPLAIGIYFVRIRQLSRKSAPAAPKLDLAADEARLDKVAADLTRVEHAMARGENADLRNLLDYATRVETAARKKWALAKAGDTSARKKLAPTVADAVLAANQAVELARRLYGDEALAAMGERAGCFFCARPLANADSYRRLALKRGDTQAEVLACPDCAKQIDQGQAPTVRTGQDGRAHWSELPGYDPYAGRHGARTGWQDIPAGRFQPQRPLDEVARLAGGAALAAGAGAALAALPLLDLNAARDTALAQEALQASARRAAEERSESSSTNRFTDHS